ncbi:MAG: hypothetical protein GYB66_14060, partial [Chloroflexi bacterium]|nr:hypothetical protein [Chloroflexota bacterium]
VRDGRGGSAQAAFNVDVTAANQEPTLAALSAVTVTAGGCVPVALNASDPDGDSLTTEAVAGDDNVATVTVLSATELEVTGVAPGTTSVTVTVRDGRGGSAQAAFNVEVTAANQEPTLAPISAVTVTAGESLPVAINASDPDGDPLAVEASSDNQGVATVIVLGLDQVQVTGVNPGAATITVTVTDGRGGSTQAAFMVEVTAANQNPTIAPISPVQLAVGESVPVPVNINDPDGDALAIEAVSDNPGIVTVNVAGVEMMVTGVAPGSATVTVTVRDGRGGTASTAFTVNVASANQDPVIDPVAPITTTVGETARVGISIADPDGDPLTITTTSDNTGIATAFVIDQNQIGVDGVSPGTATITIAVSDGRGGESSTAFQVTVTAAPTATPPPAPTFDISQVDEFPDFEALQPSLMPVYTDGVNNLGRNPMAFSIAGDESLNSENFLDPITTGQYNLGASTELQATIDHYNFGFRSVAMGTDWTTETLLDPAFADPELCQPGESPFECELRLTAPVVIFISFTPTNATRVSVDVFQSDLEALIDVALGLGTVPVLVSLPDDGNVDPAVLTEYNLALFNAATRHSLHPDLDMPLWNLYNTMAPVTQGIYAVGGSGPADYTDPALAFGVNRRGRAALVILEQFRQTFIAP